MGGEEVSGAVPANGNEPGRAILPVALVVPVGAPDLVLFLVFLA
jgi:hypothetical protein